MAGLKGIALWDGSCVICEQSFGSPQYEIAKKLRILYINMINESKWGVDVHSQSARGTKRNVARVCKT